MDLKTLVEKYSRPGPRYTSYPTAPQFSETIATADYEKVLKGTAHRVSDPVAIYIHIPFCESLCHYCGCNIEITKKHSVSRPYLDALKRELETVASFLGDRQRVNQISWGGGTPTFFSCDEILELHEHTRSLFCTEPDAEVSIEIDPRVTTTEQLNLLADLGFNRASLGVQDFNQDVQKAVHRMQELEMTGQMLQTCRELGFRGVNFDLIYGLPHQTIESFEKSMEEVITLRPDRIALYNYAHLPSLRPHQKLLERFPMPDADTRLGIFLSAYQALHLAGYESIGMDHFALKDDELYQGLLNGSLYRNFMGYTVKKACDLIGIGASAIGELDGNYFQNLRESAPYQQRVTESGLAVFRGFLVNDEDRRRKWVIQHLMCQFKVSFDEFEERFHTGFEEHFAPELASLNKFFDEGLLELEKNSVSVTPKGRLFVRNAAMAFDAYLQAPSPAKYSKTV